MNYGQLLTFSVLTEFTKGYLHMDILTVEKANTHGGN